MKSGHRMLSALVLGAWLLAVAHVALDHCAAIDGTSVVICTPPQDSHSHEESGEGHHHHFGAWATQSAKVVSSQIQSANWIPLTDFSARLAELLWGPGLARAPSGRWESPPDGRASGWLYLVQTALPVRGPSLAA